MFSVTLSVNYHPGKKSKEIVVISKIVFIFFCIIDEIRGIFGTPHVN
jgi:hypothetical protein